MCSRCQEEGLKLPEPCAKTPPPFKTANGGISVDGDSSKTGGYLQRMLTLSKYIKFIQAAERKQEHVEVKSSCRVCLKKQHKKVSFRGEIMFLRRAGGETAKSRGTTQSMLIEQKKKKSRLGVCILSPIGRNPQTGRRRSPRRPRLRL